MLQGIHSDYQIGKIASGAAISTGPGGEDVPFDLTNAKSGAIRIPSEWTAADVSFVAAEVGSRVSKLAGEDQSAPTYAKVRKKDGTLVKITGIQTTEAGWYDIPAELFGCRLVYVKSTNTASEADANQGADRKIVLSLKS